MCGNALFYFIRFEYAFRLIDRWSDSSHWTAPMKPLSKTEVLVTYLDPRGAILCIDLIK